MRLFHIFDKRYLLGDKSPKGTKRNTAGAPQRTIYLYDENKQNPVQFEGNKALASHLEINPSTIAAALRLRQKILQKYYVSYSNPFAEKIKAEIF